MATVENPQQLELPFLSPDIPGIGGEIKCRNEDFVVEEVPLYEPSGSGTHTYIRIEKCGISTPQAVSRLAGALNVPRRNIGYAGLKDARAIASQWFSVEHIDEARPAELSVPGLRLLATDRHANKIKIGHLRANRFKIRIRNLALPAKTAVGHAERTLEILCRRGVANYFGPQRFGNRNDTHLLGEAIVRDDIEQFIDLFLGSPSELDKSVVYAARTHYIRGDYQKAHDAWPNEFGDQRRALRILARSGSAKLSSVKKKAIHSINRATKRFFISAFQSHIFNQTVSARLASIDKLLTGDMAYKHDHGACFRVEDAELEQPRCGAFEISPTGPLFGPHMRELTGPAGQIEQAVLNANHMDDYDFGKMRYYHSRGGRRPLRFRSRNIAIDCGTDDMGEYLQIAFELDPGCYATTLLREIVK